MPEPEITSHEVLDGKEWLRLLSDHPAVKRYGGGISSRELSSFIGYISMFARSRIMGTGHEQYDKKNHQVFEDLTPPELILGALEEFADGINYLGMIAIKMMAAYSAAVGYDPDA